MSVKEHAKHVAIVAGIVVVTMVVVNFLAASTIPGLSTIAKKIQAP